MSNNNNNNNNNSHNNNTNINTNNDHRKEEFKKFFQGRNDGFKAVREQALKGGLRHSPIRSLIWKVFLGSLRGVELKEWEEQTVAQRKEYRRLVELYMVDPHKDGSNSSDIDASHDNPLSQNDDSLWQQWFRDTELQKEINQDIVRTYPEKEFFRSKEIGKIMLRILFIYARQNPNTSYRQGMHELLAPILYLLFHENQATTVEQTEKKDSSERKKDEFDAALELLMDENYFEDDSFFMFCQLMNLTNHWFVSSHDSNPQDVNPKQPESIDLLSPTLPPNHNAIVKKCHHIQHVLLKEKDPQLYAYLQELNIEPQLYLLRWVRLLLGREFHLDDVLMVWDGLFAFNANLLLLDYLCVAMLFFIRSQLLTMDYNMCLRRLFKYPPVEDVTLFLEKALQFARKTPTSPSTPTPTPTPTPTSPPTTASDRLSGPTPSPSIRKANPRHAHINLHHEVEKLQKEVERHQQTNLHMANRLERIIYILQKELVSNPSVANQEGGKDLSEDDSLLIALAELKQVKDILSGLLPSDFALPNSEKRSDSSDL